MYPAKDARELAILLRISRELDVVGDVTATVMARRRYWPGHSFCQSPISSRGAPMTPDTATFKSAPTEAAPLSGDGSQPCCPVSNTPSTGPLWDLTSLKTETAKFSASMACPPRGPSCR